MMTSHRRTLIAIAILSVCAAVPALAHGARGFGPGRGPSRPTFNGRGVLNQLIFPCPAGCADDAKTCTDAADSAAVSCISAACASEITTAQAACQADRRSENCHDAIDALADCADSCLDTRGDAVDVCRDAARDCRDACESEE
jgi:hypothetical protein